MKHNGMRIGAILLCILLAVSALTAWKESINRVEGIWVHVIDVGQADCLVIETAEGNIMIDTGTDISESQVRGYLRSRGLTSFAYLILSHPHDDHIGNADMILEEFHVERVISADCVSQEWVWRNFLLALENAGAKSRTEWIKPVSGTVCHLGRIRLEILMAPSAENNGGNNDSLIVRVDYGNCSMLFTGDAEMEEEEALVSAIAKEKLDVDFLKVAHHGSSGSTTENFLQTVSPRWAVISCGAGNTYSHPHEELLNRLRKENAEIYRTDLNGTLLFFCDGKTFTLKSHAT